MTQGLSYVLTFHRLTPKVAKIQSGKMESVSPLITHLLTVRAALKPDANNGAVSSVVPEEGRGRGPTGRSVEHEPNALTSGGDVVLDNVVAKDKVEGGWILQKTKGQL